MQNLRLKKFNQKVKKYLKNSLEKEEPKTEIEKEYDEGMNKVDTTKRDVSKLDRELTQEEINILNQHNENFKERFENIEEKHQMAKIDVSKGIEYDEMCDDVLFFVQKTMRAWELELNSKPTGWEKTLEGRKATRLFKETKRNFLNLYEVLLNRVRLNFNNFF